MRVVTVRRRGMGDDSLARVSQSINGGDMEDIVRRDVIGARTGEIYSWYGCGN